VLIASGELERAAGERLDGREGVGGSAVADSHAVTPARHLAALAQHAGGELAALHVNGVVDARHKAPVLRGRGAAGAAAELAVAVGANAGDGVVLKDGARVALANGDGGGSLVAHAGAGHLGGIVGHSKGAKAQLRDCGETRGGGGQGRQGVQHGTRVGEQGRAGKGRFKQGRAEQGRAAKLTSVAPSGVDVTGGGQEQGVVEVGGNRLAVGQRRGAGGVGHHNARAGDAGGGGADGSGDLAKRVLAPAHSLARAQAGAGVAGEGHQLGAATRGNLGGAGEDAGAGAGREGGHEGGGGGGGAGAQLAKLFGRMGGWGEGRGR
jgi:hypothetical protein